MCGIPRTHTWSVDVTLCSPSGSAWGNYGECDNKGSQLVLIRTSLRESKAENNGYQAVQGSSMVSTKVILKFTCCGKLPQIQTFHLVIDKLDTSCEMHRKPITHHLNPQVQLYLD